MKNKIRHFLTGSLIAVCIVCIVVFTILAVYLSRQNEQTITQLGNIYMSSMNERITKHFGSITDHRLVQMKALAEDIPLQHESRHPHPHERHRGDDIHCRGPYR